jgi:hypothetical protein
VQEGRKEGREERSNEVIRKLNKSERKKNSRENEGKRNRQGKNTEEAKTGKYKVRKKGRKRKINTSMEESP